jgi:acetyl-CoA acetyltransferase
MRDVSIIGIGQTKVGEHWDKSLKELATESILGAIKDAGFEPDSRGRAFQHGLRHKYEYLKLTQ